MTPTSPQPPVNFPTAYEGMATAIAQLEKENERLRAERDAALAEVNSWFDAVMPDTVKKLPSVAGMVSQLNNYCSGLRRERDEALSQVKMFSDNEGGALTFHILRTWGREKLERFCLHLLGDWWQEMQADRKKALEILDQRGVWTGADDLVYDRLVPVFAELTAARARLAELQAVVDAAVKYSNAHHFEVGNGYKFYCVDKQADNEFDAALDALAALASGAESETTK